ncbi:pentapeptide repeat-containing protein [Pseudobacteriovorax antillogorgiicola]|uniref:Pentapeptide repeat-containing protein n=1 Tax=Pseudobacteriovorax antillogorgiicola TaxID=1513793 RepID=A0A1Y6BYU1_9BACT|nr:pentapeptide repeat-containing protein [Pseudobacteriovorax antillogorgiicola]TCS53162.1 pentapeptide repeat protein [Pseudobacteriovorax antillogorgiicola]SMF25010.1 Pentapeptide repeat-containing protein [Pseudobacteriovorax antillogorgiicola]
MEGITTHADLPDNIDTSLYNMVASALKENPKTRALAEEQILAIAQLAVVEGKVNDELWLHDQIKAAEDASPHIPGSKILKIPVNQPASIENQADLDQLAEAHQLWMDSVLHPTKPNQGGRANLRGCDLRGLSLEGLDLRGANLQGANLSGCAARGVILTTADLRDADLSGAQLISAKLRRCKLDRANFSDANLEGADLRRVQVDKTIWKDVHLEGALLDDPSPIKS